MYVHTSGGTCGSSPLNTKSALQLKLKHGIRTYKGAKLSNDALKGDRTFADDSDSEVEDTQGGSEIVFEKDLLMEDEIDDEELLFEVQSKSMCLLLLSGNYLRSCCMKSHRVE
jgi:hypothetical protein